MQDFLRRYTCSCPAIRWSDSAVVVDTTSARTCDIQDGLVGGPWTEAENDRIVLVYFAMLGDGLEGRPYNKAKHDRELQTHIGRGKGAIEYKHKRISGALIRLAQTWILRYRSAFNTRHPSLARSNSGCTAIQSSLPPRTASAVCPA